MKVNREDPRLPPAEKWRIAGTPVPKKDGRDFVTGAHRYTSDMRLPGMLYGKVVRPNAFQAKLISCDTSQAERIQGASVVRDGDFIGVSAPQTTTADRAASAVPVQWN